MVIFFSSCSHSERLYDVNEAPEPESDTSSIEEESDEDKEKKKAAGGKKEKKKKTEGRAQEEGIAGTKQGNRPGGWTLLSLSELSY